MQNFIKTIINGVQKWTKKEIKKSTADWNQNDDNAADYVKNRTHWEEGKRTVLVYNLTFADYDNESRPKCNFVPGKKYDVIWNGKLYEGLVCWFDESYNIIASSDNGCPFYIDDDGGNNLYIEANGDNNWVVSIIEDNTVVHKLDSKYIDLPDNLATTDDVQEAVDIANNKMNANNPVGTGSFSMGRKAGTTVGGNSHAEGNNTTASGDYSHAEGETTTASGYSSHAEGSSTVASMAHTHAEGFMTKAEHEGAHAEGYGTTASGWMSHAEGGGTIASGVGSHAEGNNTTASGGGSHAEGFETIAASENQHVQGRYNVLYRLSFNDTKEKIFLSPMSSYVYSSEYTFDPLTGVISLINAESATPSMIYIGSSPIYLENNGAWYQVLDNYDDDTPSTFTAIKINIVTYAHIAGNGTSGTKRSNAHTLDWNGVGWFQGGLQVGGNAQDDGARNVLLEGDAVPVPENASVGQTIAVKAVDENGKPVEWETTDISTSGGSGCVVSDTAPEDTSVLWIDTSDDSGDETPDVNLTGYATEQWVEDQNYLTEVPEGYAKTEDIPTDAEIIQLIKDNAPEHSGGGIAVTGATVGQTVKISAVDENGVPTAWMPTDFPSGGGEFGELELIVNHTVTAEEAEASSFMFTKEKYPLIDGQRFLLARITKPTGVSAWMKLKAGSTIIASWNSNTQLCFTTLQLVLNGYWFGGIMDGSNPNGGATIPLASFVGTYKAYGEIGGTPYVYYDSLQLYSYMAFLPEGTIIEIYGGR